jgi:hypothetical protein
MSDPEITQILSSLESLKGGDDDADFESLRGLVTELATVVSKKKYIVDVEYAVPEDLTDPYSDMLPITQTKTGDTDISEDGSNSGIASLDGDSQPGSFLRLPSNRTIHFIPDASAKCGGHRADGLNFASSQEKTSGGKVQKLSDTDRNACISHRGGSTRSGDGVPKKQPAHYHPEDSYSFMTAGPLTHPLCFFCGLLVFAFQVFGIFLVYAGTANQGPLWNGKEKEDFDNPDAGMDGEFFAVFIPSNAAALVRCTQIYALLVFALFQNESSGDIINSIRVFSSLKGSCRSAVHISNVLRFFQGLFASFTAIILIMSDSDAVNIVLNITAVNYISGFDETFFAMALNGWFGSYMLHRAKEIANGDALDENEGYFSTQERATDKDENFLFSYLVGTSSILIIFTVVFSMVVWYQNSYSHWTTEVFRVRFEEPNLEEYSGCYQMEEGQRHDRRMVYKYIDSDTSNATFAYCREHERWVFLTENMSNPCIADNAADTMKEKQIAYSPSTLAFDISHVSEATWVSPSINKPLDMYFTDLRGNSSELGMLFCDAKIGNGKCDDDLNTFDVGFDGGDCCATSCIDSEFECGEKNASVFGVRNNDSFAFQNCSDPDFTEKINVTISDFEYKDIANQPFEWIGDSDMKNSDWKEFWKSQESAHPTLKLECSNKKVFYSRIDGSMKGRTEKALVAKHDENCELTVDSFDPIFNVSVDVNSSRPESVRFGFFRKKIKEKSLNSIPTAIGNLTHFTDKGMKLNINLSKFYN